MAADDDSDQQVPERERAHQQHRDRKRETRMVVDNAGIRRVLPALRRRRASPKPAAAEDGTDPLP